MCGSTIDKNVLREICVTETKQTLVYVHLERRGVIVVWGKYRDREGTD